LVESVFDSDEDRRVLNEYIVDRLDSSTVATRLAMSEANVRKRASRIRPKMIDALIGIVSGELNGPAQAFAQSVFCRGVDPGRAAMTLGVTAMHMPRVLAQEVIDATRRVLGGRGVQMMRECRRRKAV
jgi:hypothetical protein